MGQVHLYDGSAQGFLLDKVKGKYAYHDGQVDLSDVLVKALSAEIMLSGTMSKEQNLDFTMEANNVNLERLPIMASDLDLQGFINLSGHVSGNLEYPYFAGEIDSEEILVNGERLSELSGSLESNGRNKNKLDIRFKQPYANDESNYGLFTADLNLNIDEKYMQGKVLTLWGNLGGILRMAKLDYNVDGTAQGELVFAPNGKGRGHLHHRLMNLGYGQRRATLMRYGVSAIVGIAAVMFSRSLNVEGLGLVAVALMQIYIFLTDPNHVLPQIKQEKAEAAMAQLHAKQAAARAEAAAEAGDAEPKDAEHEEAKASMLAAYRSRRMMEDTKKSLDEWR